MSLLFRDSFTISNDNDILSDVLSPHVGEYNAHWKKAYSDILVNGRDIEIKQISTANNGTQKMAYANAGRALSYVRGSPPYDGSGYDTGIPTISEYNLWFTYMEISTSNTNTGVAFCIDPTPSLGPRWYGIYRRNGQWRLDMFIHSTLSGDTVITSFAVSSPVNQTLGTSNSYPCRLHVKETSGPSAVAITFICNGTTIFDIVDDSVNRLNPKNPIGIFGADIYSGPIQNYIGGDFYAVDGIPTIPKGINSKHDIGVTDLNRNIASYPPDEKMTKVAAVGPVGETRKISIPTETMQTSISMLMRDLNNLIFEDYASAPKYGSAIYGTNTYGVGPPDSYVSFRNVPNRNDNCSIDLDLETASIFTNGLYDFVDNGELHTTEIFLLKHFINYSDVGQVSGSDESVVVSGVSSSDTDSIQALSETYDTQNSMLLSDTNSVGSFEDVVIVSNTLPFEDTGHILSYALSTIDVQGEDGNIGEYSSILSDEMVLVEILDAFPDGGLVNVVEDIEIFYDIDGEDLGTITYGESLEFSIDMYLDDISDLDGPDTYTSESVLDLDDELTMLTEEYFAFNKYLDLSDTHTISISETSTIIYVHDIEDQHQVSSIEVIDILTEYPPILNDENEDDIRKRSDFIYYISRRTIPSIPILIEYPHIQISDEEVPEEVLFVVVDQEYRIPQAVGWAMTHWNTGTIAVDITRKVHEHEDILAKFDYSLPERG